jgi:hypothetical protein
VPIKRIRPLALKPRYAELDVVTALYDDASTRAKLAVMDKYDAMLDDGRNPTTDFAERVETVLTPGRKYRVYCLIEDVGPVDPVPE